MANTDTSYGQPLLTTENLVTNFYTYEGVVKALNKVSLTVEEGSTFGLVGESGCGKSVTVRSIMRIVQQPGVIECGKVFVHLDESDRSKSVEVLSQSEEYMEELRGNQISMIFQEPNAALNPVMSIGDQVSESFLFHQSQEMAVKVLEELDDNSPWLPGLKAFLKFVYTKASQNPKSRLLRFFNRTYILRRWQKRMKKEAWKRSIDILDKLGISNPERIVASYPHNLSGGMKQRVVIGIALACSPILLIADEATSNLDVTIQAQILDLLKQLKKEVISSILLITHDLGVVAETCDRVGVMYAGNLVEVADVKELFENPVHPYSSALLDAVPKFNIKGRLESIEGNVPNLVTPPSGCRFHPRCKKAKEICSKERPELVEVNTRHMVACHLTNGGD